MWVTYGLTIKSFANVVFPQKTQIGLLNLSKFDMETFTKREALFAFKQKLLFLLHFYQSKGCILVCTISNAISHGHFCNQCFFILSIFLPKSDKTIQHHQPTVFVSICNRSSKTRKTLTYYYLLDI